MLDAWYFLQQLASQVASYLDSEVVCVPSCGSHAAAGRIRWWSARSLLLGRGYTRHTCRRLSPSSIQTPAELEGLSPQPAQEGQQQQQLAAAAGATAQIGCRNTSPSCSVFHSLKLILEAFRKASSRLNRHLKNKKTRSVAPAAAAEWAAAAFSSQCTSCANGGRAVLL